MNFFREQAAVKSVNALKDRAGTQTPELLLSRRGYFKSPLLEFTVIKDRNGSFYNLNRILVVVLITLLSLGFVTPSVATTPDEILKRFGDYYAIVIGINKYSAPEWGNLAYAEQDARDIEHILTEFYGFEVTPIYGAEATRKTILKTIRVQLTALDENDNLLIYYAGHGLVSALTDEGYWIPVDAPDDVEEESWISFSQLKKLVEARYADVKRVALITDSCYGGALTARSGVPSGRITPEDGITAYQKWLIKNADHKGRLIIASGGIEEVPDQSEFSDALKATLEENELEMMDLYYLYSKILRNSYFQDQEQTPSIESLMASKPGHPAQFVLIRRK